MEGQPRYRGETDRRYEQDLYAAEYYREVAEYLTEEIIGNPERRGAIEQLQERMWLMQQLLPFNVPSSQQAQSAYVIERALEAPLFPHVPVTLPPPGRTIDVGKHMTVTATRAVECWPDDSKSELPLKDGTIVKPQTLIGKLDIVRNLPQIATEAPLISFTRQLVSSSVDSLRELATLCEQNDQRILQIHAVAGTSHLARLGNRFGFTTFKIENSYDRRRATEVSRKIAAYVSGNNQEWQVLQRNYKPAEVAFISRSELVSLYGSKGPEKNILARLS